MTWWAWLVLWTVLVVGAVVVQFLLVRRVWRGMKAVGHEISELTRRIDTAGLPAPIDPH